jgi:hypothetical protein
LKGADYTSAARNEPHSRGGKPEAANRDTHYFRTATPSSIVPYISMLLPDEPTGVLAPPCAQAAHDSTAMTAQAARMIFIGLCFPDKTRL